MPLHIYEGLTGKLITTILKPGRRNKQNNVASLLKKLICHLREQWPDTLIIVRGDLMTITQYQLPIKIIVFNNLSLGMVKLEMQVAGIPDFETDMLNPDFIIIAEAMGMTGIGIDNPDDVKSGLEKAFMHEGPVLVSIQTDPNALAMPPKLEFDQMKGFALYMGKMMLSGRMDEAFKIISSNYKHLGEVL
jgi:pyruvate dehydrogenase (quinone)